MVKAGYTSKRVVSCSFVVLSPLGDVLLRHTAFAAWRIVRRPEAFHRDAATRHHMYVCMYMYMYMYMHMHMHMHMCIYAYMHICICIYVYMYICIYVYMYICIYAYMHIYIYIYRAHQRSERSRAPHETGSVRGRLGHWKKAYRDLMEAGFWFFSLSSLEQSSRNGA